MSSQILLRFARPVLSAAVIFLVGSAMVGCKADIQSGIESANDLLYQKEYVASDRLYRKLLKQLEARGLVDSVSAENHLLILDRLGKINNLYLHDYKQAVLFYRALIKRYPKSDQAFSAHSTIADIYHHKLGDIPTAINDYQEMVGNFPNHPKVKRVQLKIINAYFQLKNFEQVRTEAEQLIHHWPNSNEAAEARFKVANSFYVQNRFAEAIATYEALLKKNKDELLAALVLFELGNCFQELGNVQRALDYYYASLPQHSNPKLVQRKIARIRSRNHKIKVSGVISNKPMGHNNRHPVTKSNRSARSGPPTKNTKNTKNNRGKAVNALADVPDEPEVSIPVSAPAAAPAKAAAPAAAPKPAPAPTPAPEKTTP